MLLAPLWTWRGVAHTKHPLIWPTSFYTFGRSYWTGFCSGGEVLSALMYYVERGRSEHHLHWLIATGCYCTGCLPWWSSLWVAKHSHQDPVPPALLSTQPPPVPSNPRAKTLLQLSSGKTHFSVMTGNPLVTLSLLIHHNCFLATRFNFISRHSRGRLIAYTT